MPLVVPKSFHDDQLTLKLFFVHFEGGRRRSHQLEPSVCEVLRIFRGEVEVLSFPAKRDIVGRTEVVRVTSSLCEGKHCIEWLEDCDFEQAILYVGLRIAFLCLPFDTGASVIQPPRVLCF